MGHPQLRPPVGIARGLVRFLRAASPACAHPTHLEMGGWERKNARVCTAQQQQQQQDAMAAAEGDSYVRAAPASGVVLDAVGLRQNLYLTLQFVAEALLPPRKLTHMSRAERRCLAPSVEGLVACVAGLNTLKTKLGLCVLCFRVVG